MEKTQKMIQSELTRERLLSEATRLFARKGYFATSIADLAAAAEVTKGAIYHHFENKESVFFAVIENIRLTWKARWLAGSSAHRMPSRPCRPFSTGIRFFSRRTRISAWPSMR